MNDTIQLSGLARQLVLHELLDEKAAQQAQSQAQRNKLSLVTYLVQSKLVKGQALIELAADQFGIAYCDLNSLERDSLPKDLISEKLVRQHRVVPLWRRGNKLFVGISDPANHQAINDVQFSTGLTTEAILVEDDKLGIIIEKLFENATDSLAGLDDVDLEGLDISERRKPQDGRIKMRVSKTKSIDFRVNTLPTLWGEKIVMRILDSSSAQMGIDALGYEEDQKELYLAALKQPQGMILVTGPTGSGKTVSLYTGLNILNTTDINISTAEDPVEINLEGINQVNVNPRQGMDFSQALRAFLRQDPDVIMVGEIRDLETAEIAIKAAQTGHMVMSTLHTNSAAETLTRLLNMGVPAFNLATSVNLIIAQRLARKLCSHCKKEHEVPKETLLHEGFPEDRIGTFKLYSPVGCDHCKNGYKGRVGIYEVVKNTPALQRIIMEEGNSIEIAEQARKEGFNDLRTSGLLKAMQGITSLEEVNRVTKD
ncbi:TPA: Flp pilus assembly complex ATPase component TadA [Pseudomonas aeruginosa]|nr:Flp pilus assembly complex ATPase component TadA [Pseudomonas aeruginosa]